MLFFLCSSAVIQHFPEIVKSKPFKSGYSYDKEEDYYIIQPASWLRLRNYFYDVIEPFNQKSNIPDIDFWFRDCTESLVDEAPKGTLTRCRSVGVFVAIEQIWGLTNEKNRAFCIYQMAKYYGLSPIEFINKI